MKQTRNKIQNEKNKHDTKFRKTEKTNTQTN